MIQIILFSGVHIIRQSNYIILKNAYLVTDAKLLTIYGWQTRKGFSRHVIILWKFKLSANLWPVMIYSGSTYNVTLSKSLGHEKYTFWIYTLTFFYRNNFLSTYLFSLSWVLHSWREMYRRLSGRPSTVCHDEQCRRESPVLFDLSTDVSIYRSSLDLTSPC